MPRFRVAIWYPTIQGDDIWESKPLTEKLAELETAVASASGLFGGGGFQGIFVCPEYTLTAGGQRDGYELPIPVQQTAQLFNRLEMLSRRIPRVLFIPGSMMVVAGTKVQNRVIGYYGGESVIFCGKKDDVGEAGGVHTFEPGNGGGTATIEGLRFGLQICRDASRPGYLSSQVDVHIVVSAGLALDNIVDPNVAGRGPTSPRVRVLAERSGTGEGRGGGGIEYNRTANIVHRVAALEDVLVPNTDFNRMKTVLIDYV
jgi:hypothetical protein